jgi:trimethylamine---corrinoid protein Co-methyltransferase
MTLTWRPSLNLWGPEECERVVNQACRVLREIGVLIENEEGRALLEGAGAAPVDGRHRIPEAVVRHALSRVPARVPLFDRDGELALDLGEDRVHFDPGSAAIYILETESRRRRPAVTSDVIRMIRLVDGLPQYAAQSTALVSQDVPAEVADRYRLYLALRYGRKPVITGTFRTDGFAPMMEMLWAVRGSKEALAEKPLAVFDCCPSPPLKWSDLTCRSLLDCARSGVPAELVSMPLTGATAPVTLRDAVVQHCAENLSGIVLHQLAAPGAPIIYGGAPSAFDMRHGTTPMGAVETMMIDIAYARVGKHLGLPTHAYMALSDTKVPDYQAGLETGMGAVLAALAGINLVSGAGILDYILTQSLEKLVLDAEACGMALRLTRGIAERSEDPVELIAQVVRTGEFLSHPHTRRYWREELSIASPVLDRDSYGDWETAGGVDAEGRARAEVRRRLNMTPPPPPAPAVEGALQSIMEAEAARCGLSTLPDRS